MLKPKNNSASPDKSLGGPAKFFLTAAILVVVFAVVFLIGQNIFAQDDIYGVGYAGNVGLGTQDIRISVIKVIRVALGVLGILALILVIYAGVVWMTSGGNEQKIETAKKILLNAVIGLVIILFAFAIVQFIFSRLSGNGSGSCQENAIRGQCDLCVNGIWQCQGQWPGCDCVGNHLPNPPASNQFIVNNFQTSHGALLPDHYYYNEQKSNVYWCSKIQTVFNHNIDQQSFENAVASNSLKVAQASATGYSGQWTMRGNTLKFTPEFDDGSGIKKIFAPNARERDYSDFMPSALEDVRGLQLRNCSLGADCEDSDYPDFRWDFYVGSQGDTKNPTVANTYPSSDGVASRDTKIRITFSEEIDADTVIDPANNINPYPGNIYVYKIELDGSQTIVPGDKFAAAIEPEGFSMSLINGELLDAFSTYEVTIQNIADLCGNLMQQPFVWKFQTNNQTPGVSNYAPQGSNVCPDTNISITFNTSMYGNVLDFYIEKLNSTIISSYQLDTSIKTSTSNDTSGQPSDIPGEFYAFDTGQPKEANYRVFKFNPASDLGENSHYRITVKTDKIKNISGEYVNQVWDFNVTDLANCVCSPTIDKLNRYQGPTGECLTIYGNCFRGTSTKPATISSIKFGSVDADLPSDYSSTAVATIVPNGLDVYNPSSDNSYPVAVAITYQSSNDVSASNDNHKFMVLDGQANGPCLWSVRPDAGQPAKTKVTLTGIRFGDFSQSTHQTIFTQDAIFPVANATDWTDTKIINITVPSATVDGEVVVENSLGKSNGMPFNAISCNDGSFDPGEQCDGSDLNGKDCQDLGFRGGNLACAADCKKFDTQNCSNAPRVVENGSCLMHCDDAENKVCYNDADCNGVACLIDNPPSPNPYKNNQDVCLNAAISADFNTKIDQATFNNTNIYIEKCLGKNCFAGLTAVAAQITSSSDYSFILAPTNNLTADSWYQVTLTTGIKSADDIAMENDYLWQFKTKAAGGLCSLERVNVKPDEQIVDPNISNIPYYALPIGANCTIIKEDASNNYDWQWSIIEPTLNSTITENPDPLEDAQATVKSGDQKGTTYVRAETETKYDKAKLNITFDTCAINDDCNKTCPGSTCDISKHRCTPVVNFLSPVQGPAGRWLTVKGCQFKSFGALSQVDFGATPVSIYPCGSQWSESEILVEVPAITGLSPVTVTDRYGLTSNNNRSYGLISGCLPDVPVPDSGLPGLCSLSPNSGQPGDSISINGQNFGLDADTLTFNNTAANASFWSDSLVRAAVPETSSGDVVAQVKNCPSNGLYFNIKAGKLGDPCDSNLNNKDVNGKPVCDANNNLCWSGFYCDTNKNCTCQQIPPAEIIFASQYPSRRRPTDCRNTIISATFNQKMSRGTINADTVELWERVSNTEGKSDCVLQSDYVLNDRQNRQTILAKILSGFKKLFKSDAAAQTPLWWCPVSGSVTSYDVSQGKEDCDNSQGCAVFTFSPRRPLGSSNVYEIHIKGGSSGVKSELGGELKVSAPVRTKVGPSYYWNFAVGNKICQIDHVNVTINTHLNFRENVTTDFFTCAGRDNCADDINQNSGNQHEYTAQAYDANNQELSAGYAWQESDDKNLIEISPLNASQTLVTANPFDGESIARVTAGDLDFTDDFRQGTSTTAVNITNALCQNPWPSLESYPYTDSAGNCNLGGSCTDSASNCNLSGSCLDFTFFTYYCRDYGDEAITADDLPAIDYTIKGVAAGYCVGGAKNGQSCPDTTDINVNSCGSGSYCYNVLKDFLFTFPEKFCEGTNNACKFDTDCSLGIKCLAANNVHWCGGANKICTTDDDCLGDDQCEKNIDSIGVRVYNNNEHLSPPAWYEKYAHNPGSYSRKEIDSYEAIVSGRTNYVGFATDKGSGIYTDMFLISHSDNYQAVTLNIYDQLIKNLKFNAGYVDNVRACTNGKYCTKDSDCPQGETCNAEKDKLARDVIRFGHLNEMKYQLEKYRGSCTGHPELACQKDSDCPNDEQGAPFVCLVKNNTYPLLSAGTYLQGSSVSVWDSWHDTFAKLLGASPLLDPINEVFCDDSTAYNDECWDKDQKKFQCDAGSHFYHYEAISGGQKYKLSTNMEYAQSGWQPGNITIDSVDKSEFCSN